MNNTKISYATNKGPLYAALVIGAWLCVHIYSVVFHNFWTTSPFYTALLIALQCWLYTGLFIIAHDCIHGTLFPQNAKWNKRLGQLIMFVYAGFSWAKMQPAHMEHHKAPGTEHDPDFNAKNPKEFWPWYIKFFTTYFGWQQVLTLMGFTLAYVFILGAPVENTIVMWAVPAILSSAQLFYFGTYLPHRHDSKFADHHNARSNDYPAWASLLSCFHFGYHHEHHLYPHEPWWRLPARRHENIS